uniref:Lipoprotein n=1 Tax=Strongyloides papillosus TaxID=174720 RepID=A0A0N5BC73_STREA
MLWSLMNAFGCDRNSKKESEIVGIPAKVEPKKEVKVEKPTKNIRELLIDNDELD